MRNVDVNVKLLIISVIYLHLQIVEHKHHVLLEEKRKKAMDMHLEFIVDQTAKYSNWLVKGLASKTPSEPSLQSVASHDGKDSLILVMI